MGALDSLGKYMGMAKERIEHSGPNGSPIAADVLHSILLQPAVLERLDDAQVERCVRRSRCCVRLEPSLWLSAAVSSASVAAAAAPVVEGEVEEVEPPLQDEAAED